MKGQRRVFFYKIARDTAPMLLFDQTLLEALRDALKPTRHVTRYRRSWHLSSPRFAQSGYVMGKVGFVHETQRLRTIYDSKKHDFVDVQRPDEETQFVHFVIRPDESLLAFEVRPPTIQRQSVVGALQNFITSESRPYRLIPISDPASFPDWRASVDVVTSLSVTAVTPNPSVGKRARALADYIKDMNARKLQLTAESDKPGGLNTDEPLLRAAAFYAPEGYGRLKAVGMRKTERVTFDSASSAVSVEIVVETKAKSESFFEAIIAAVERRFRGHG